MTTSGDWSGLGCRQTCQHGKGWERAPWSGGPLGPVSAQHSKDHTLASASVPLPGDPVSLSGSRSVPKSLENYSSRRNENVITNEHNNSCTLEETVQGSGSEPELRSSRLSSKPASSCVTKFLRLAHGMHRLVSSVREVASRTTRGEN